jgi:hypothetical protein
MEVIKITKCVEVVDNWGNTETYKGEDLYKLLISPEDWTDDQRFISDNVQNFDIDELIGKTVQVGTFIFKVQE